MQRGERTVDRLPGGGQYVPGQEQQHADGRGVEQGADAGGRRAHPAHRQTEQDRHACDQPEEGGSGQIHSDPLLGCGRAGRAATLASNEG